MWPFRHDGAEPISVLLPGPRPHAKLKNKPQRASLYKKRSINFVFYFFRLLYCPERLDCHHKTVQWDRENPDGLSLWEVLSRKGHQELWALGFSNRQWAESAAKSFYRRGQNMHRSYRSVLRVTVQVCFHSNHLIKWKQESAIPLQCTFLWVIPIKEIKGNISEIFIL